MMAECVGKTVVCGLVLLMAACAGEWRKTQDADGRPRYVFQTARIGTLPPQGLKQIAEADLQAGDILLSAGAGVSSAGLRLFGNSAVSHAFLYLGRGEIAEAVGSGVRIIPLREALRETTLSVAFRRQGVQAEHIEKMRAFARQEQGGGYNYFGVAKQAPYSVTRLACELPVVPRYLRRFCLSSLAMIQITPFSGERFFCSQFVIEAFNRAGLPLTDTPPEWVSPADMLHMREGDVASVLPVSRLQYVGHLQCRVTPWNISCRRENAGDGA
ncbi:MAG: hypothetical protein Q4A49_03940 [Neisseria sp.]|nr:hypothetical protein [Neisseria sp.]